MYIESKSVLEKIFLLKGQLRCKQQPRPKGFGGVEIAPFQYARRAAACISADFELNWAWREWPAARRDAKGLSARRNVPLLLQLLEDRQIPITWAAVGHLFLDSCSTSNGAAHPELPRPPKNDRWQGDWYMHDPCTTHEKDPLWYAPDLIEEIQNSPVAHEIGTHSFSHIDFSPGHSTRDLVERELQACRQAMSRFSLAPRSLVFPFNRMGYAYLDLLAESGITAVRHRDPDFLLSYPQRTPQGVYKLYESMGLRRPSRYPFALKAEILIQKAIESASLFHLWFHPSDPTDVFEHEFASVLETLARKRDQGDLWLAPMSRIAAYCEAREKVSLRVERPSEGEVLIRFENGLDQEVFGTPELSLIVEGQGCLQQASVEGQRGWEQVPETRMSRDAGGRLVVTLPVSAGRLRLRFA